MPKMVCTPCQLELKPIKNGVIVVEHSGHGPYTLWEADEWACPECGVTVVAGFADQPYARNCQSDFTQLLEYAVDSGLVRHDYEDVRQRESSVNSPRPQPLVSMAAGVGD